MPPAPSVPVKTMRSDGEDSVEVGFGAFPPPPPNRSRGGGGSSLQGPVDLDEMFDRIDDDADSLLSDEDGEHRLLIDDSDSWGDDYEQHLNQQQHQAKFFNNPNRRLLDNDASLIPGSPFSKPPNKPSTRPAEPLAIAKYTSVIASMVTIGWVAFMIVSTFWYYDNVGRILAEIILSLLSFFGLAWNSYFVTASIFKCFIPAKAFKSNTKYCSIIPESATAGARWLDITIQIPVYKESLKEVLMPTLQSCMKARDYYLKNSAKMPQPVHQQQSQQQATPHHTRCNIVVCDDGMMAMLRDNFAAAEMLWENIVETQGRIIRLRQLLKKVPRASRRHLKGLRSKDVYEVFHRMIFYYHFDIGFVARSTVDRRGKFKKASNLNSHLRLSLGAAQLSIDQNIPFEDALLAESHNEDGSRYIMFGNDIKMGDLICVNDADARMAESVMFKTVPEFLNDPSLGFTQHATKTMNDQRGETYFTNMLTVYTDALYQGHFLLSSILGCHPPLVGHSIFLRTEAVKQCGRMRTLRKAQRWLRNIGLPFLPVDQVGLGNLQAENRIEYWSENHVSEDFELMIHLYNLGFNGRYCAYPDCEFQEGITRTFDEEAGRHRKFALGAHELVFNSFPDMFSGHGIFTPLFRTFLTCDIPSYYKIFLTAYLCSYSSGGAYLIVFIASAVARILDSDDVKSLVVFSPAGVIILNFFIYYVLGYVTFLISLLRMHFINNKLLFPEYRKKWCGAGYLVFVMIRYCMLFQFLFYGVATFSFYFLGSMDHLMARPGIVSATNKDSITISRCTAFWEMVKFNSSSFALALIIGGLAYATILQDQGWDYKKVPDNIVEHALFAGPALFLMVMCFVVPIILNPYILGWPFLCRKKPPKKKSPKKKMVKKDSLGREIVDFNTFMKTAEELQDEIERVEGKPDVELGSLGTKDLRSYGSPQASKKKLDGAAQQIRPTTSKEHRMSSIPEAQNERPSSHNTKSSTKTSSANRQSVPDPQPGKPKRYNDHFPYSNYPKTKSNF